MISYDFIILTIYIDIYINIYSNEICMLRQRRLVKFFENAETRYSKALWKEAYYTDDVVSKQCRFDFILGYKETLFI